MNRFLTKFAITRDLTQAGPHSNALRLWTTTDDSGVFFGFSPPLALVVNGDPKDDWKPNEYVIVIGTHAQVPTVDKNVGLFCVTSVHSRLPGLSEKQSLVRFERMSDVFPVENPREMQSPTLDNWALWYAAPLLATYRSAAVRVMLDSDKEGIATAVKNDRVFRYAEIDPDVKSGKKPVANVGPRDFIVRVHLDVPIGADDSIRATLANALRGAGYKVSNKLTTDTDAGLTAGNELVVRLKPASEEGKS